MKNPSGKTSFIQIKEIKKKISKHLESSKITDFASSVIY